ncbi:MAG: hypothetical protein ACW981_16820 [Candidatus Hodarchaeales archaeon]|jgi:hypothetical protein
MNSSNSDDKFNPDLDIEEQEIIENLDRIVNLSEKLLQNNNHGLVFNIFHQLVKNDLHLRQKIADELFPGAVVDFEPQYSPEELNSIIQLQTFANNFRIALLIKITEYIINKYKNATQMVEDDFNQATRDFKYAQDLDHWYIKQIKRSFKESVKPNEDISEFESQMYDEMVQVLSEVSTTGLNSMQKMLKEAMHKYRFEPFK